MLALSVVMLVLLVGIDQLLKFLVTDNIMIGGTAYSLSFGDFDFLSITHIRNRGAAWSILEGKTILLIAIAAVAILIVFYFILKGKVKSRIGVISLTAMISGGLGNMIDRIRLNEVVDYIKVDFIDFPVFNFADICVVLGAICFCIWLIVDDIKSKKQKKVVNGDENS